MTNTEYIEIIAQAAVGRRDAALIHIIDEHLAIEAARAAAEREVHSDDERRERDRAIAWAAGDAERARAEAADAEADPDAGGIIEAGDPDVLAAIRQRVEDAEVWAAANEDAS